MKQFNPKAVAIESETALALIQQQHITANQYGRYIGLDVHKDTIAVSIAAVDGGKPRYYGEIANKFHTIGLSLCRIEVGRG